MNVYLLSLILGLGMLVLSLIDDIFDFDFDFSLDCDVEGILTSFIPCSMKSVFLGLAVFGVVGLTTDLHFVFNMIIGIIFAYLGNILTLYLKKHESLSISEYSYIGCCADVLIPIKGNTYGSVSVKRVNDSCITFTAVSNSDESFNAGEQVIISSIKDGIAFVERI